MIVCAQYAVPPSEGSTSCSFILWSNMCFFCCHNLLAILTIWWLRLGRCLKVVAPFSYLQSHDKTKWAAKDFHELINDVEPSYQIPLRGIISSCIEKRHFKRKEELKVSLQSDSEVAITFGFWTSAKCYGEGAAVDLWAALRQCPL